MNSRQKNKKRRRLLCNSEIRHVVKVYFPQTLHFGLAHTMRVCIADDFLDDCATAAGCDRRLLALSLPLGRLTSVLRRLYSRLFFAKTNRQQLDMLHSAPGRDSLAAAYMNVNDRITIMAGCHRDRVCISAFISVYVLGET